MFLDRAVPPLLKWPGGKTRELPGIRAAAPVGFERFVEPFVGGGSVLLSVDPSVPAVVNDRCPELAALYEGVPGELDGLCDLWDLPPLWASAAAVDDPVPLLLDGLQDWVSAASALGLTVRLRQDCGAKLARLEAYETRIGQRLSAADLADNLEGAVRASLYLALRARYNDARSAGRFDARRVADFFVVRELCYAAMFRFNASGGFNVPYGGVSYNSKGLRAKVDHLRSAPVRARLESTEVFSEDFEAFLEKVAVIDGDFCFVDPPYDSDFSAYDDREFGAAEHARLAAVLQGLPCPTMVVIKDSPLIRRLYAGWNVAEASKTYAWTIKSRNDRAARHLTLTNY